MVESDLTPSDDTEIPYDLMKRAGIYDDPPESRYFKREEIDLTAEDKIRLLAGAQFLTERQAEAYVYRRIEELSRDEASAEMGIEKTTLDDYLRNADDKITVAEITHRVYELLSDHESGEE